MKRFDGVVLAGGASRRMGSDKATLTSAGGRTLLGSVVEAVARAEKIVVVGPRRSIPVTVTWTRESPEGGGPVAAVDAGLSHCDADIVVVLACDLPLIDRSIVRDLVDGVAARDGCTLKDRAGRVQPLAGAYSRPRLEAALHALNVTGASMKEVIAGLDLVHITSTSGADVDTLDDAAAFGLTSPSGDASRVR